MKVFKLILLSYFFFFAIAIFGGLINEFADGDTDEHADYARITDVEYKAVVLDDVGMGGKLLVTEKLTFDIHAASNYNLFWELWRDLPESEVDGLKVDYDVLYVKELLDSGEVIEYTKSPKLYWYDSDYTSDELGPGKWFHSPGPYNEDARLYECVLFYIDGVYRDKLTFEIQYIMNNAAFKYDDVSELYLSMYSGDTIKYLNSFKAQILIPNKDMPKEGNYSAYTFGTNSHTFPYKESSTLNPGYHTFYFNLYENDLKFKPYNQYIEFSLLSYGDDKHAFTHYAPNNIYTNDIYLDEALEAIQDYNDLPIKAERNKKIILVVSLGLSILILIYTLGTGKRIKNKYKIYEPTMNIDYYRDIPSDLDPYFAASLVFCKNNNPYKIKDNGYSAIMLNLIRKKYIELERIDNTKDWTSSNIMIKLLYSPGSINKPTINVIDSSTLNVPKNIPVVETSKEPVPLFPTMAGQVNSYQFRSEINNEINKPVIAEEKKVNNPFIEHSKNVQTLQQALNKTAIFNNDDKNININGRLLDKLSPNEEAYFNLLVRHTNDGKITMTSFQEKVAGDYDNTDTFVTNVDNSIVNIGVTNGYFQSADYKQLRNKINKKGNTFIIIALLIIILAFLVNKYTRVGYAYGSFFIIALELFICASYLKILAKKYILLTKFGEDEYTKWRGLYNFLNSQTLMKERTVVELPLWEKYLVYATAFGISEKVKKALEIRKPELQDSAMLDNDYYRSDSFRIYNHSFSSSTRSASSISRSGGFSGSYYGGGGRGGGGGGGGH